MQFEPADSAVEDWEIKKYCGKMGSCVLKAPTVECRRILSIYTRDRHLDQYSVETRSTLDQQPVYSRPSINRLVCSDWKLVNSHPTVNWDVNWLSTKVSMECRLRIDQVSIESIDWPLTTDAFSTHDLKKTFSQLSVFKGLAKLRWLVPDRIKYLD